jgi:hypothetical protein
MGHNSFYYQPFYPSFEMERKGTGKLTFRIFGLPAIVATALFFAWMLLTDMLAPEVMRSDLGPSLTIVFAVHVVFAFVLLVYLISIGVLLDLAKRTLSTK